MAYLEFGGQAWCMKIVSETARLGGQLQNHGEQYNGKQWQLPNLNEYQNPGGGAFSFRELHKHNTYECSHAALEGWR